MRRVAVFLSAERACSVKTPVRKTVRRTPRSILLIKAERFACVKGKLSGRIFPAIRVATRFLQSSLVLNR